MNGTTTEHAVKPLPVIPPYGENAIDVQSLTFAYRSDPSGSSLYSPNSNNLVLQDMNLALATGSRCLLIGANGSGKSVSQGSRTSFTERAALKIHTSYDVLACLLFCLTDTAPHSRGSPLDQKLQHRS